MKELQVFNSNGKDVMNASCSPDQGLIKFLPKQL